MWILAGQRVCAFLGLLEVVRLFSRGAVRIYTPTPSFQECLFLHMFTNTHRVKRPSDGNNCFLDLHVSNCC